MSAPKYRMRCLVVGVGLHLHQEFGRKQTQVVVLSAPNNASAVLEVLIEWLHENGSLNSIDGPRIHVDFPDWFHIVRRSSPFAVLVDPSSPPTCSTSFLRCGIAALHRMSSQQDVKGQYAPYQSLNMLFLWAIQSREWGVKSVYWRTPRAWRKTFSKSNETQKSKQNRHTK